MEVDNLEDAVLCGAGIFVRPKSPNEFQVQLSGRWIDVEYSKQGVISMYRILGLDTDNGYAPLRRTEDLDWVKKAIDSVAKGNGIKDYMIHY